MNAAEDSGLTLTGSPPSWVQKAFALLGRLDNQHGLKRNLAVMQWGLARSTDTTIESDCMMAISCEGDAFHSSCLPSFGGVRRELGHVFRSKIATNRSDGGILAVPTCLVVKSGKGCRGPARQCLRIIDRKLFRTGIAPTGIEGGKQGLQQCRNREANRCNCG